MYIVFTYVVEIYLFAVTKCFSMGLWLTLLCRVSDIFIARRRTTWRYFLFFHLLFMLFSICFVRGESMCYTLQQTSRPRFTTIFMLIANVILHKIIVIFILVFAIIVHYWLLIFICLRRTTQFCKDAAICSSSTISTWIDYFNISCPLITFFNMYIDFVINTSVTFSSLFIFITTICSLDYLIS